MKKCSAGYGAIPVRIGSVSGIAGRGDTSLIHPVPDEFMSRINFSLS